jgi:hypothetical protein
MVSFHYKALWTPAQRASSFWPLPSGLGWKLSKQASLQKGDTVDILIIAHCLGRAEMIKKILIYLSAPCLWKEQDRQLWGKQILAANDQVCWFWAPWCWMRPDTSLTQQSLRCHMIHKPHNYNQLGHYLPRCQEQGRNDNSYCVWVLGWGDYFFFWNFLSYWYITILTIQTGMNFKSFQLKNYTFE